MLGVRPACRALSLSHSRFYRRQQPARVRNATLRTHPRALDSAERAVVLEVLHSARFCDRAPSEIYATLLDEGQYLCSVRTMYRLLAGNAEVRERRAQRRHRLYTKPELLATAPNQVWTWDLTKLLGPQKWIYYHLYVVLDLFSRYVVAWMLAHRESGELGRRLIAQAIAQQNIEPGQLTVHADRGAAPTAKTLRQLFLDLGVEYSYSRPSVSNDNPFSESQFKTLKYAPGFPARFGSYEDAQAHCQNFFARYNTEHRHSGIAYLTPEMVHHGRAATVIDIRRGVLEGAHARNPKRFVRGVPVPASLPSVVWINPPEDRSRIDIQTPKPNNMNANVTVKLIPIMATNNKRLH